MNLPALFNARRIRLATVCALGAGMLSGLAVRDAHAEFSFYGITSTPNAGNLSRLDRISLDSTADTTPTVSTVFQTNISGGNGLAFDQAGFNLYYRSGSDNALGSGNGLFFRYNTLTNTNTQLTQSGGVSISNLVFASASYWNGAYYAMQTGNTPAGTGDNLYRVTFSGNTYTAALWLADPNGGSDTDNFTFGDIAITEGGTSNGTGTNTSANNTSGVLFGFGQHGGNNRFFRGRVPTTANTAANSTLTDVIETDRGAPTAANPLIQLGFARTGATLGTSRTDNVLYGHNRDTGQWYTISTAATAAGGSILTSPFNTASVGGNYNDITNAAYQPVPAPPAAVSLGIGGLVGLMGTGVAKLRSRRRKSAAKKA